MRLRICAVAVAMLLGGGMAMAQGAPGGQGGPGGPGAQRPSRPQGGGQARPGTRPSPGINNRPGGAPGRPGGNAPGGHPGGHQPGARPPGGGARPPAAHNRPPGSQRPGQHYRPGQNHRPPVAGGPGRRPPRHFMSQGRWRPSLRGPRFIWPSGYGYRLWAAGAILPGIFLSGQYFYDDYSGLGLSPPPPGYRWVRYGPDLLLVNVFTGRIADVVEGVFY